MDKINIILADDHRLVLDGIESMLQQSPYHIAAMFPDGEKAVTWLKENHEQVGLVITDISMPVMNGIELCKLIKSSYPHLPVLMLSMYSSVAATEEALEAEADGFILKNAGKEEFISALHRISNGGTYFSEEIIPLLCKQVMKERKKEEELSLLTAREKEILEMIAQEQTSDAIAAKLFISKKTVDNHRTNMLQKTGSQSTIGLVKFAIRNGIVKI
jgi:two-component system nitrate/nitrite response regulator NarL